MHVSLAYPSTLAAFLVTSTLAVGFSATQGIAFTPSDWDAQGCDVSLNSSITILGLLTNHGPHAPDKFFQRFLDLNLFDTSRPPYVESSRDCTDINDPSKCNVKSAYASFVNPFAGTRTDPQSKDNIKRAIIANAYENIMLNLGAMHAGVQKAHDEILSENFIDTMVQDLGREDLPIARSTLFKLVKLSLNFIPIPGGAAAASAELKAFTTWAKRLKSLGKNATKNGKEINQSVEENEANQRGTLTQTLEDVVSSFKASVEDQYSEIFINPHADNFHQELMTGGVHLGADARLDPGRLEGAIKNNLKMYLIATMMNNINYILTFDKFGECDASQGEFKDGDSCKSLVLAEPGVPVTRVTADKPRNVNKVDSYGLSFGLGDIMNNAVACSRAGKTAADVDYTAMLNDPENTKIPFCLFGFRVDE